MFLGYVETHVRKARTEGWTEQQFYTRMRQYFRSVTAFGPNLGDLLIYWDNKKELFWSFVLMDHALVRKKMLSLVLDKLGIFQGICENHTIEFTLLEEKYSDQLFVTIRKVQNTDAIESFANDADLMILADCIVYVGERLVQGMLYLVTNDKGLHGTTSAIIEQPKLIYPDLEDGRMVGLEPLYPQQLVKDYNRQKLN